MKSALRKIVNSNKYLRGLNNLRKGYTPVFIEYEIDFRPRWEGGVGNAHLDKIIAGSGDRYRQNLKEMSSCCRPVFNLIQSGDLPFQIDWRNNYIPALDGFSLMWAALKANKIYMEIGSGNSTLFAKSALIQADKETRVISIDPFPRTDVDMVCDEVIRQRLEDVDLSLFDRLGAGDVLFVDNSHRSFMNSDVTVFMLEILPRLKPGVLIGIHDVFLPYDYFESWSERGYNEQYLLGCYLLSNPGYFDICLANYWVFRKGLHHEPFHDVWAQLGGDVRDRSPAAFWAVKK